MGVIRLVFDWLLILCSLYVLSRALQRMIMRPSASLGNYVILITWIFCCLPILLDYTFGRPEYIIVYWYYPFIAAMANDEVSLIYDLLIVLTLYALHFYCNSWDRKPVQAFAWSSHLSDSTVLMLIVIWSPFVYIVAAGLFPYMLKYGDPGTRGMPEGSSTMVTALLLLSIIAFCVSYFKKKEIRFGDIITFIIYSFAVAWISGKRFMIALLILLYLYFYLSREVARSTRKRLVRILPVLFVALLGFSAFYLVGVRPLSDTSLTSVYEMLRVDFGRDDVTKYSIYHEFFLDDHILDYPGESFLSTFFVWVPRAIWPSKPFQDYQYLTSSILGLPISLLPAGTTPSWWEMCICNFSYAGTVISIFGLLAMVALADRAKTVSARATAMVIVIALMTQSVDAYIALVLLLIAQQVVNVFIRRRAFRREMTGSTFLPTSTSKGGVTRASYHR